MTESLLELFAKWDFAGYIYAVFLVFVRVGATIALLPGFGEHFIPARFKLFISVILAYAIQPLITDPFGIIPSPDKMTLQIINEFTVGLLFGFWVRIIYLSLTVAAGFCSQTLGITNIFDATLEPGGAPALSGFFSFVALAVLMSTGGHYFILQALVKSYDLFHFTKPLNMGDASLSITEAGSLAISLGLRLSIPFIIIGFIINVGLGFVNRAMPQIPVFFVGQPLMIGVGFILLSMLISTMIVNWGEAMRQFLLERL